MAKDFAARLKETATGGGTEAVVDDLKQRLRQQGVDEELARRGQAFALAGGALIHEVRTLMTEFDARTRLPYLLSEETTEVPMGVYPFWFPPPVHDPVREILREAYVKCLLLTIEWAVTQPGQSGHQPEPEPSFPFPKPAPVRPIVDGDISPPADVQQIDKLPPPELTYE